SKLDESYASVHLASHNLPSGCFLLRPNPLSASQISEPVWGHTQLRQQPSQQVQIPASIFPCMRHALDDSSHSGLRCLSQSYVQFALASILMEPPPWATLAMEHHPQNSNAW
ncbi:hypothetical protein V6Z93_005563, partial [Aspergillus fumigatus]